MLNTDRHYMPEQLSRHALLYLLVVFVVCNGLAVLLLPWWLLAVSTICLIWRSLIFLGRVSFPSSALRVLLVLAVSVALYAQYRITISLDVFVTLLILGFSLKLLEVYHKKDTQILLYLAVFVLMTIFLYQQTMLYAVLVFTAMWLVLSALVALHDDERVLVRNPWQPLQKGVQLFALSLPVMLLMFVVMPRLPPLWAMPLQTQQAKTGMSDSMSPGDVASLAQSSDLVFRATFAQSVPPRTTLYWYGAYLDHFDGVRWTDSCANCRDYWARASSSTAKTGSAYQVILEPSGRSWLYVLMPSIVKDGAVFLSRDGIARYAKSINQRTLYDAEAINSPVDIHAIDRKKYLALPAIGNEKSKALAQQWRQQLSSDAAIIEKALRLYHDAFSYTLQPPLLQGDRVDDFLFRTRSGFCEHFASSFVFLMRAAGIPARVAVGYMGGELYPRERFVVVRQYDAHAWAEVWLPEKGWQRVDPTAAVAPERIDLGFSGAYEMNAAFAGHAHLSMLRRFSLLNQMRLQFDRFDYLWARWVLGYGEEQQQSILQRWGLVSPLRIALWGGGIVVLAFVILCVFLLWRERKAVREHPATRAYRAVCECYTRFGVSRQMNETPVQYAERVVDAGLPQAAAFALLSQSYYQWLYLMDDCERTSPPAHFSAGCRHLRWQLWWRGLRR